MIDPILASAAEISRVYLIGGAIMLYLLFLWNKKLVKKIAKWTLSLATLAVVFTMVQGFVEGPEKQDAEREPLVRSQYYRDPMAQAAETGR